MRIYNQEDVDKWVDENGEMDATFLLAEMLPKLPAKLDRLDKRIREVLQEVQQVFPDAQYYTASGGFNLVLGSTHDERTIMPKQQRVAWYGQAAIGDGDW